MKKITKILIAATVAALLITSLISCGNMTLIDTTYSFEKVMIALPDGTFVEGECTRWSEYENSDMIQVTVNGKTYLTHSTNVVLISE